MLRVQQRNPKRWETLDAIQRRWNRLVSSDPSVSIRQYVMNRYLSDRTDLVALSLACGSGEEEIRWAESGRFTCIDAFDVSERRIDWARTRASMAGVEKIVRFEVGDMRDFDISNAAYDVVVAFNALTQVTPLGRAVGRIAKALKPGGLLVVRDYVGPDRFQWSPREVEVAEELLARLPVRYRVHWESGTVKKRVLRPGRLMMALSDPSEASRSSQLVALLDRTFVPVERKDIGGAVLPLVLKDIAHNFDGFEQTAEIWLDRMIRTEDELIASGEIPSHFVFGVWEKAAS